VNNQHSIQPPSLSIETQKSPFELAGAAAALAARETNKRKFAKLMFRFSTRAIFYLKKDFLKSERGQRQQNFQNFDRYHGPLLGQQRWMDDCGHVNFLISPFSVTPLQSWRAAITK
jgi:hypothetical protein